MSRLYNLLLLFSLLSPLLASTNHTGDIYELLSDIRSNLSALPIPVNVYPIESLKNLIERPAHFINPGPNFAKPQPSSEPDFLHKTAFPFFASLFGFFFIITSIVLLWFNEKKAVDIARIVNYGERVCEEVNPTQYDAELNGELVHVMGRMTTQRQLHDQSFGVIIQDCIKLKRVVEVYQVMEHKLNKASPFRKTSYKYEPAWCEYLNPSAMFKQEGMKQANSKVKFISHGLKFTADNVEIGSFKLTPYQIERLDNWVPLELSESMGPSNFSRDLKERINGLGWENPVIQVNENCLRIKQGEMEEPQIGDIRVSFYKIPCDTVTIIAEQAGITFKPYNIKEKRFLKKGDVEKSDIRLLDEEDVRFEQALEKSVDRCCWSVFCGWTTRTSFRNPLRVRETVDWIYPGKISKKDFFNSQIKVENRYFTMIVRMIVTAMMTIGIYLEFGGNLKSLAVMKRLGKAISWSWAFLLGSVGCGILAVILVAGFAWMFYKKMIGYGMILAIASIVGAIFVYEKLSEPIMQY